MDAEKERPGPDATGHGPEADYHHLDHNDGRAAKQLAFDLFHKHRAGLIAEARRHLIEALRQKGRATIENVRERMEVPKGINPKWLGVVPGPLARKGIIRRVGYEQARRATAHARPLSVWELMREPEPGELEDSVGKAPDRPDQSKDGGPGTQAEKPSRPDRPAGGAGWPLFPDARPPYRDPGDATLDRAGRRR